jgi:hypothetical protein
MERRIASGAALCARQADRHVSTDNGTRMPSEPCHVPFHGTFYHPYFMAQPIILCVWKLGIGEQ